MVRFARVCCTLVCFGLRVRLCVGLGLRLGRALRRGVGRRSCEQPTTLRCSLRVAPFTGPDRLPWGLVVLTGVMVMTAEVIVVARTAMPGPPAGTPHIGANPAGDTPRVVGIIETIRHAAASP